MKGPRRDFATSSNKTQVSHDIWVRVLPAPFRGEIGLNWLQRALKDKSPDILQISMQYVKGAITTTTKQGVRIAGEAQYGPESSATEREEGADFNDYLGISWKYADRVDGPERRQHGCLDCSGYMRMIWGYRSGLVLSFSPAKAALPRRSYQMLDSGPGIVIIPDRGVQKTKFSLLAPGDLVFFDADPKDGTQIDHVGMYFGLDNTKHHRFISSRKRINGPTLGDFHGKSVLDGTGLYARSFRAARRL